MWTRWFLRVLAGTGPRRRHVACLSNPIRVSDLGDLTMLIGPGESAALLEVGVAAGEAIEFIVHAMPARAKFLE